MVNVVVDSNQPRSEILDYQVDTCPTCKSKLEKGFGLAGGGFGPYGYCEPCGKLVWKCVVEE